MAKNTKGGLGRGLNSLIGGYEAPAVPAADPVEAQPPARETVHQNAQPSPQVKPQPNPEPAPKPAPAVERQVIRAEDLGADDYMTIKNAQGVGYRPVNDSAISRSVTSTGKPVVAPGVSDTPIAKTPVRDVVARKEYIEEDDGVRIKSVKARPAAEAKPQQKVEAPTVDSAVKEEEELADTRQLDEVPLNLIKPNPDQPRTNFRQEDLEELAASIEKDGLLQPILVREMGDGYQIIAGERRWQACKSIGLVKVPVRIKNADDDRVLELALIENLQRSDLNPIEEAYGYKRMMERGRKTQAEVATVVSKGRSTIANALRLLDLPEEAQQLLFEDKITAGHARAILSIPTEEGRAKLTEKLRNEKLSVREAEAIARLFAGRQKAASTPRPPVPQEFKSAARHLASAFDTKVRIKSSGGKNKIEIEFKDEEDLHRIYAMMTSQTEEA